MGYKGLTNKTPRLSGVLASTCWSTGIILFHPYPSSLLDGRFPFATRETRSVGVTGSPLGII